MEASWVLCEPGYGLGSNSVDANGVNTYNVLDVNLAPGVFLLDT
jgi:hypothetical protein